MDCLYVPSLFAGDAVCMLPDDAFAHARALRLRAGESVLLSNGTGLCAVGEVHTLGKDAITCRITQHLPEYGELPYHLVLALGILDNRERMEFAIEKAVELGATSIIPLLTDHSEQYAVNRIKPDRLRAKAIAAMQQSQRSRLTTILPPCSVSNLHASLPPETLYILADADAEQAPQRFAVQIPDETKPHAITPTPIISPTICLTVGAEGGFSASERLLLMQHPRTLVWKLAPRRLRAETAAMIGLSAITLMADVR